MGISKNHQVTVHAPERRKGKHFAEVGGRALKKSA
jgi:hypothetical protein